MFRSSLAATVFSGLSILSLGASAAHAAGPSGLIAHRAVYGLELKDASDRSGISGMVGRMVYEFEGSDCTGFTTNFRFVTKIDTGDSTRVSDQQTTTFEDLGKRLFRFETKSYTDSHRRHRVDCRGAARRDHQALRRQQLDRRRLPRRACRPVRLARTRGQESCRLQPVVA